MTSLERVMYEDDSLETKLSALMQAETKEELDLLIKDLKPAEARNATALLLIDYKALRIDILDLINKSRQKRDKENDLIRRLE